LSKRYCNGMTNATGSSGNYNCFFQEIN